MGSVIHFFGPGFCVVVLPSGPLGLAGQDPLPVACQQIPDACRFLGLFALSLRLATLGLEIHAVAACHEIADIERHHPASQIVPVKLRQ